MTMKWHNSELAGSTHGCRSSQWSGGGVPVSLIYMLKYAPIRIFWYPITELCKSTEAFVRGLLNHKRLDAFRKVTRVDGSRCDRTTVVDGLEVGETGCWKSYILSSIWYHCYLICRSHCINKNNLFIENNVRKAVYRNETRPNVVRRQNKHYGLFQILSKRKCSNTFTTFTTGFSSTFSFSMWLLANVLQSLVSVSHCSVFSHDTNYVFIVWLSIIINTQH